MICEDCKLEMTEAEGCVATKLHLRKGTFDRLPYLDESGDRPRCHDCGATHGKLHHAGCDMERCPRCKRQLIGCDCTHGDGTIRVSA